MRIPPLPFPRNLDSNENTVSHRDIAISSTHPYLAHHLLLSQRSRRGKKKKVLKGNPSRTGLASCLDLGKMGHVPVQLWWPPAPHAWEALDGTPSACPKKKPVKTHADGDGRVPGDVVGRFPATGEGGLQQGKAQPRGADLQADDSARAGRAGPCGNACMV